MQNAHVRKFDEAYERLLVAIATRASGRGILVLAVLLYGGIGLALPLTLGWTVAWLVSVNIIVSLSMVQVIAARASQWGPQNGRSPRGWFARPLPPA